MSLSVYRALLRLYPSSYRAEHGSRAASNVHGIEPWPRGGQAGPWPPLATSCRTPLLAHWEILRHDVHYAARTMSRSRGFVTTVVLVTALGVGANTATFSVADAVLLRPLPFPEPERAR